MGKDIVSETESNEQEIEHSADNLENYLKVMYGDLNDIDNLLPKLDSANLSEAEEIYKKLNSESRPITRGTRRIRRIIRKMMKPYKTMLSTAEKEKKSLLSTISEREKKIAKRKDLASKFPSVKRNNDLFQQAINEAKDKVAELDRYIGKAEEILNDETALEQRLMLHTARGGSIYDGLKKMKKDISSKNLEDIKAVEKHLHGQVEAAEKMDRGLFTTSERMKKFVKSLRTATIATAMALTALSGMGAQEANVQQENIPRSEVAHILEQEHAKLIDWLIENGLFDTEKWEKIVVIEDTKDMGNAMLRHLKKIFGNGYNYNLTIASAKNGEMVHEKGEPLYGFEEIGEHVISRIRSKSETYSNSDGKEMWHRKARSFTINRTPDGEGFEFKIVRENIKDAQGTDASYQEHHEISTVTVLKR